MDLIRRIEIKYFRSIYNVVVKDVSSFVLFTGKNDVGKSNVLKALNLFFNNQVEMGKPFTFTGNFNLSRLEQVKKDSVKGKQFISITITFNRGNYYEKTLPSYFSITKKWYRNDVLPSEVKDDIERRMKQEGMTYAADRSKMSLSKFLHRINYFYVPAIKDEGIFAEMLVKLRATIYNEKLANDKSLLPLLNSASKKVAMAANDLNKEFYDVTHIETKIIPPETVDELYKSLEIVTEREGEKISIHDRGDGIRVRYIPSILNYIAKNSKNAFCIWGYEEPENSLEYNLAVRMAEDFVEYAKNSQIIVTTHSPAFIGLGERDSVGVYRCFMENSNTNVLDIVSAEGIDSLAEELGYYKLQQAQYKQYVEKIAENELLRKEKERLSSELRDVTIPVLMTEGKTDVAILTTAWEKLYSKECPFVIKSCNAYPEDCKESAAGCSVLADTLRTWKYDAKSLLIGLFDYDEEGIKSFELDANFDTIEEGIKRHRNNRSYAMVLPKISGKEAFYNVKNFCIEFMFPTEKLLTEIDGKRLILDSTPIETRCGRQIITTRIPDFAVEPQWFKPRTSSKTFFAEQIVPTFSAEDFDAFDVLFRIILRLLGKKLEEL